jgi:hypothetical protein
MLDLFIGFVVGCAVGYVAREMLSRYRRERVRRERVEGRYGLWVKVLQMVTAKFPTQRNREFLQPEQGIFIKEQGISRGKIGHSVWDEYFDQTGRGNSVGSRNPWSFPAFLLQGWDTMGNRPMLDRATSTENTMGSLGGRADMSADKAHWHADAEFWFRLADRLDYSIRRWVIPADDGVRDGCWARFKPPSGDASR